MSNSEEVLRLAQKEIDCKLSSYKGKKVSELKEKLNLTSNNSKTSFVQLAKSMLEIKHNEFELNESKLSAVLKTTRLTGMKTPAESMAFKRVDFDEWINNDNWEKSSLQKYFKEKVFILFIFQQFPTGKRVEDNEMTFHSAKIWKMSEYDLNHGLKEVWEEVRNLILSNALEVNAIKQKGGRVIYKNNFPSSKFNYLGHLRPGAVNGKDKIKLPTGQSVVKQKFWFNSGYLKEILDL